MDKKKFEFVNIARMRVMGQESLCPESYQRLEGVLSEMCKARKIAACYDTDGSCCESSEENSKLNNKVSFLRGVIKSHEVELEKLYEEKEFSREEIAQLKKQLAEETAERERLEDNEDAMVAYHDELGRDLAEADDAIVSEWFKDFRYLGRLRFICVHCNVNAAQPGLIAHTDECVYTKANARIEARKGKGD
jgi:hypothetical protein